MSLLEAVQSARGETPSQTFTSPQTGGASLLNAVQSARGEVEPTPITQPKKKLTIKPIFEAGKKLISQITGYVKAAKEKPFEAAAGAGTKIIQFFGGDLAGSIQQGVASVVGVDIPDRWNLKKQAKAFEELNRMNLGAEDKQSISAQAFETGKFIGAFVPYYFAGAVAGASVGTKILAPIASKFIPKAVKLVPVISNAIGFTGVGQLEYDKEIDGARVDRLKTDLVMLALFEVGGALAKGIAKGTSKIISKAINGVSNKLKGGDKISIAEIEKVISETKQVITKDTGKPAEVVLANNITNASEKEIQALTLKAEVPKAKVAKAGLSAPKGGSYFKEAGTFVPEEELKWSPKKQIDLVASGKKPAYSEDYATIADARSNLKYAKDKGLLVGYDKYKRAYVAKTREALDRVVKSGNAGAGMGFRENWNPTVEREHGLALGFKDTQATKGVGEVKPQISAKPSRVGEGLKVTPQAREVVTPPVGEVAKPSKIGIDIEAKAIEKRLTKSFGGTAEYTPTTIKEQSKIIANLTKDIEKVKRIFSGEEPLPSNVKIGMLYKEMEEYALKKGDMDMLMRMAKSPLTSETSFYAQELRFLAERETGSPVKTMSEVIKVRAKTFEQRYKGRTQKELVDKTIKDIKSKIKAPDKWDWNNFIKSISC